MATIYHTAFSQLQLRLMGYYVCFYLLYAKYLNVWGRQKRTHHENIEYRLELTTPKIFTDKTLAGIAQGIVYIQHMEMLQKIPIKLMVHAHFDH